MNNQENFTPNFTQIPNVIFDYWMSRLKPSEFSVLLCLCRKIYGWHKTTDYISISQISRATGLTKNTILKAIEELIKNGLVLKSSYKDIEGNHPNEYKLNIEKPDDDLYQTKPRKSNFEEEGGQNLGGVVQILHQGGSANFAPTKERPFTKENKSKREAEPPPARAPSSSKSQKREHVRLSEEEHNTLVEKFGSEKVEQFYNMLQEWKEDTPRSKWKKNDYRSILRWVVDAHKEALKKNKQETNTQDNLQYSKQIQENFKTRCQQRMVRIDVTSEYIEFMKIGAQAPSICIKFSENGFREQVESLCRKWGLI